MYTTKLNETQIQIVRILHEMKVKATKEIILLTYLDKEEDQKVLLTYMLNTSNLTWEKTIAKAIEIRENKNR